MKILITVASKHGSTGGIGEIIAGVLRDAGSEVTATTPEQVTDVGPYDAVVVGSGVYAGRWLAPARRFVERFAGELGRRPVWLFSSGPIGDPPVPEGDAPETVTLAERVGARGHRSFAGRLDRGQLGFVERTITKAIKAPEGDFRDWEEIRSWADTIAATLTAERVPA
jgi:menaquinone-dependent protoporphyrinogen oxidase